MFFKCNCKKLKELTVQKERGIEECEAQSSSGLTDAFDEDTGLNHSLGETTVVDPRTPFGWKLFIKLCT